MSYAWLLGLIVGFYAGSALYKKWQFTVWDDLDAGEQRQVRNKAVALFGGGAALSACAEIGLGYFLLTRTTKRRSSH